MKRIWMAAIVLSLVGGAYWSGWRHGQARQHEAEESRERGRVLYYVDPMNPAHTSDKPGLAPCGMKMEAVYAEAMPSQGMKAGQAVPVGTVHVTPERQQLIGLRLGTAEKKPLRHTHRLLGKVAIDETRLYRVNATIDGWITRTLPVAAGSFVKKDEVLAQFYSPEFLAAAQAMIFALGSADRVQATGKETEGRQAQLASFELGIRQYRDSLRNLGMGSRQIEELIRTRHLMENIDITAPAEGYITARNVSEGQRFEKGTELFRLADLSHVWIWVDVFEKDAGFVQTEGRVAVSLPNQGKRFTAAVSKTLPQFDSVTRTIKLRLEADNPDYLLKPDMFADVELPISLPEAVVVPADAVMDAGLRQTVFVSHGQGYFEPRQVGIGARVGDQVQILDGLRPGEPIVVAGNFLLDSESRMKLAAGGRASPAGTDPVCGMEVEEKEAREAGLWSRQGSHDYYFCAEGCKRKFEKEPAQFLKPRATAPLAPSPSSAALTP
jgi:membrane fusion protein, copper/silver efflux system